MRYTLTLLSVAFVVGAIFLVNMVWFGLPVRALPDSVGGGCPAGHAPARKARRLTSYLTMPPMDDRAPPRADELSPSRESP